jgi:hypothetical protein
MPDTIFCPNCGERISARARFCPSCGASQEEYAVDTPPKPPPPPPSSGLWSAGGPDAREAARPDAPPPREDAPPAPASRDESPPGPTPPREAAPPAAPPARDESPPAPTPPREAAPPAAPPSRDESPPTPTPPREAAPLTARPPRESPADSPAAPASAGSPHSTPSADSLRLRTLADAPSPAADEPPAPADSPHPHAAAAHERDDSTPGADSSPPRAAAEFSELIRERLALPGIVAAAVAAVMAAGVVLVAGLVIAVLAPENSILGAVGIGTSLFKETFRQAVGTLLTAMVEEPGLLVSGTRRIHPLLLAAIPLGALILATRSQLYRTEGARPLARFGWASLVAVPFAVLMLVFALIGGGGTTRISPSPGGAFALGLLWGALGGLIGAATKLPLVTLTARLPDRPTRAVLAALRPLAVILAICTVVGLAGWLVQVGRDAGEHGIHLTALAAGARFSADGDGALGLPFPVADANDVPGRGGTFRVFAYDDALPTAVFIPALILLIGLVSLGALYAGFAAARAVTAGSLQSAALWGALTGPAWAITMAFLVVLAGGLFHGDADDTSVFSVFLLGGAAFGAAGGALAVSDREQAAS